MLTAETFVLLLLGLLRRGGDALPHARYSHAGLCPNDMNPNLWVDAQKGLPCTRTRTYDAECEAYEKCCPNVCGAKSCVAARYLDVKGKRGPVGMPREATCDFFMCPQQGSRCDLWDGQPICKCRERCEGEPSFTCASDGLTYYNKCFMDAEACAKGVALTAVTCKYHLPWPHTSPAPFETTANPTVPSAEAAVVNVAPPTLVSDPTHKAVHVGDTVSFHCDVAGKPKPEITWEKEIEGKENLVMRPNHVVANIVVTNIAQLVIYNARLQDAGVYVCVAKNTGGLVKVNFPLSVKEQPAKEKSNKAFFPTDECLKPPDSEDCGEEQTRWHFDAKKNNCFTFVYGNCNSNLNHFETYESCMATCMNGPVNLCNSPALQGPCKAYEPRWAYSKLLSQCQSFIYGGCGGNENNFESKETCEDMCPFPKNQKCKACKPRQKLVTSFCRSDFAILGRVMELTEDRDSGNALVSVEDILKDDRMGLKFLGKQPLEITLLNVDRSCPCPNVTSVGGQLIIMGDARNGMAVLQPHSFVGAASARRMRKLREVIHSKTCDLLKKILGQP
ncbi:PREDICTED: WAP, Kazal, immunoglobulin, Kunitz and NTR domain-containing protein 2 [Nanorana parkeri]|uniref:WAP, Kazal, immunoglobulin, Kunitz and NTR domain-containing protein 2 n=1 Tax=Nanorana parkeri TaxID=125878 RepID=UPI000854A63F|nr:PREDICTED: WAP, Kazal, immunoglobulin, Kunitz and NTR domain-containing protein 2 [Nanorana parkeri]